LNILTPFPLERTKRSVIYDNPNPDSIKINMHERRAQLVFNVETPNERDKNHGT